MKYVVRRTQVFNNIEADDEYQAISIIEESPEVDSLISLTHEPDDVEMEAYVQESGA